MSMLLAVVLTAGPVSVELFTDKGDTFIRAGAQSGVRVGQTLRVLGEPIGDTGERRTSGHLAVLEVWDSLARVSLDAAAKTAVVRGPIGVEVPPISPAAVFDQPVRVVHSRPEKAPRNPYIAHEIGSGAALGGVWLVTMLAAAIFTDGFFATTFIPVAGPFITYGRIKADPNADFTLGDGGAVLLTSGTAQALLFGYLIYSIVGASLWSPPTVAITPSAGGGATVHVGFSW